MSGERFQAWLGANEILNNRDIWKGMLAEFVGTLFLVLIGCGSCVSGFSPTYAPTVVQIALAFGVTVATLAQSIGHVSGGHLNPAVSMAMLSVGKISLFRALFYVVCQCVGALTGAALLLTLTPEILHKHGLGHTALNPFVTPIQGFGIEFLITFVLVFVIFGVCDSNRADVKGSAPLAIGLAVSTCHLFAVPFTGSSMNPARSFGPAVVRNIWTHHWVYWFGPILGGIAAAILYQVAFSAAPRPQPLADDAALVLSNRRYSPSKEEIVNRTTAI